MTETGMEKDPQISVVVATYNRSRTLSVTLRHLAEQTLDPSRFEVIVVDDGSPDDTEDVIRKLAGTFPFRLTYARHDNRGPGYTQNRGILMSRAPIVSLIADDIFLSPRALEEFLQTHREHPEANVAVLGNVSQSPDLRGHSLFLEKWDPFKFRYLSGRRELPYYMFWACNISVKKEFLLRHGLYRENMGKAGPAAHEDVELGYRLWKKGMKILYNEKALGYHYHVESFENVMRRAYMRGLNWWEFRGYVDDPAITVRYHVISLDMLGDYLAAFRRRDNLMGADRNPLTLAARLMLRPLVFNRLTVKLLWIPLLELAERRPILRPLADPQVYRGVVSHHFFRGVAEGKNRFDSIAYRSPGKEPRDDNRRAG